MINVKEFIESIEDEIRLLEEDLNFVKNSVSARVLQLSIENRKDRIAELTEKYLKI